MCVCVCVCCVCALSERTGLKIGKSLVSSMHPHRVPEVPQSIYIYIYIYIYIPVSTDRPEALFAPVMQDSAPGLSVLMLCKT